MAAGLNAVPLVKEVFKYGTGHARMETTVQMLVSKCSTAIQKFHAVLRVSTTLKVDDIRVVLDMVSSLALFLRNYLQF